MHTWLRLIGIYENTVILGSTMSPGRYSVHPLTAHATSPAQVTRGIEGSDCGGIDRDFVGYVEEWR